MSAGFPHRPGFKWGLLFSPSCFSSFSSTSSSATSPTESDDRGTQSLKGRSVDSLCGEGEQGMGERRKGVFSHPCWGVGRTRVSEGEDGHLDPPCRLSVATVPSRQRSSWFPGQPRESSQQIRSVPCGLNSGSLWEAQGSQGRAGGGLCSWLC